MGPQIIAIKRVISGTSLAVQWLRLRASTAGGKGSITGQGTKIPQAERHGQKKKRQSNKWYSGDGINLKELRFVKVKEKKD